MSNLTTDSEYQLNIDRVQDAEFQKNCDLSSHLKDINKVISQKPVFSCSSDNMHITEELHKKILIALTENAKKYVPDLEFNEDKSLFELEQTLAKAVEDAKRTIAFTKGYLTDNNKELKRLESHAEGLEKLKAEIEDQEKIAGDTDNNVVKIRNIGNNINKEFQTTRKDLHDVISELYPNDDMKDLLADLTSSYFRGGDLYIKIKGRQMSLINTLIQAKLVDRHPNDPFKFRLTNFL